MSGLRKMIYIKDAETWESIKDEAGKCDRSVSNYLVNLHRIEMNIQADLGEMDLRPGQVFDPIPELPTFEGPVLPDHMELDDIRNQDETKPDPLQKAKSDLAKLVPEVPFSGGYSKEKQTGRKKK